MKILIDGRFKQPNTQNVEVSIIFRKKSRVENIAYNLLTTHNFLLSGQIPVQIEVIPLPIPEWSEGTGAVWLGVGVAVCDERSGTDTCLHQNRAFHLDVVIEYRNV